LFLFFFALSISERRLRDSLLVQKTFKKFRIDFPEPFVCRGIQVSDRILQTVVVNHFLCLGLNLWDNSSTSQESRKVASGTTRSSQNIYV